jgi:uncharacterized protein (TIGR02466 family)
MPPAQFSASQIWATTLFYARWQEHAAEAPGVIEHLYALRAQETTSIASGVAPGAKSREGLFESRFDLFNSEHPGLRKLIAFIGSTLRSAIAQVNNNRFEPSQINVCATESWFHITNDGGYHDAHHHHNCSWCGIYYAQAGDANEPDETGGCRNGGNRFYSPIAYGGSYWDVGNEYMRTGTYNITPEDGLLVLFPSYLLHSALPYRGTKDRIVISFNSQAVRRSG